MYTFAFGNSIYNLVGRDIKLSESGIPKKFEEIKTEIEKAVIPHITVKIFMPEGVDKEEFLKLEKDEEFLRALGVFTKKWLKKGKSKKTV